MHIYVTREMRAVLRFNPLSIVRLNIISSAYIPMPRLILLLMLFIIGTVSFCYNMYSQTSS